jgi:hypothetical protein
VVIPGGGKFEQWLSNGLITTVSWFLVLVTYCTFRAFGIEDPLLGQAFLLLTGAWIGHLTLVQGKKQARVEDQVERLERGAAASKKRADDAEERADHFEVRANVSDLRADLSEGRADVSEKRADGSEERETEWSKHKDHTGGDE